MNKPIRILLADDHPVVRAGISACLSRQPNLQVVGEAADGAAALAKARELKPDLVLMDIEMPELNGLAVTQALSKELPEVRVLILTMTDSAEIIMRVLEAGARGYILKDAPVEQLIKAIQTIVAGEAFFSPEVARAALNRIVQGSGENAPSQLTDRERDVLIQIAEGMSNKEIASHLNLGVRTVETHRERIMRKLSIRSVAGLTKYAIANGLVSLKQPASKP